MRVSIDGGLVVECSHLLNGGERVNGWVSPVFTAAQLAALRAEAVNYRGSVDDDAIERIGEDAFTVGARYAWPWEIVD